MNLYSVNETKKAERRSKIRTINTAYVYVFMASKIRNKLHKYFI